jgi:hypothetical protein
MSESLLLRLHRGQAESLRQTVEAWQAEHNSAMAARDAEELVRFCLDLPAKGEALWNAEHERAVLTQGLDVSALQAMRRGLEQTFADYVRMAEAVRVQAVETASRTGHEVDGLGKLEGAIGALKRLQELVVEQWPVCSPEEMVEVRAQIARGEFIDVEDAFADMAGISKEELRARLAEHQKKRQAFGLE